MCVVPLFTCLMTGHIPQLVIVSVFIGLLIMNIVIILVHVGSNEMAVPSTVVSYPAPLPPAINENGGRKWGWVRDYTSTAKRVKHWSPRGTLPFVMDQGRKLQSWPELEAYL